MGTTRNVDPVVVAVDGSERSAGAIRYAIHEARLRGSPVRMVHVAPTPLPEGGLWPAAGRDVEDLRSAGELILDRAVSQARASAPDVAFDSLLGRGPRATELVAAAGTGGLLVLGRETRRGLERVVAGALTAGVVARVAVPVVVVPADWQGTRRDGVVAGIKSYPADGELLARAYAAAALRHTTLRLVQVADLADLAPDAVAAADVDALVGAGSRMLGEAVRDWSTAFPETRVESVVLPGRPAEALVEAAAGAHLLLVARPHRDLRHPVRLGRTPRDVLAGSDTPVEVVPLRGDPTMAPLVLERSGEILKE
ncbi:universal stress protein [Promicromonospora kroppenstedtii]|uniref:Universal stress protein n=1 Tax=Promicromonospora kroppenstedtii TaxID=440482 RepID=A0ABW7XNX1_9MICO